MKISCAVKEVSCTQAKMAVALGISSARVSQLVKEGIAIPDPELISGAVLIFDTVKNYYLRQNDIQQESANNANSAESIDFNREHARLEKAKADKEVLRLAKMKGELYEAAVVEQTMTDIYVTLRTQLLGLPAKIAAKLPEDSRAEAYEMLTKEIESCLGEMSQYDPKMFRSEEGADNAQASNE